MGTDDASPTDATLSASSTDAAVLVAPGQSILAGRYEISGLLGTGGMGRVYRARDRELGELVALKVLRKDLVGSLEMVERFREEVRLARKVTHPNVARTFDIGEHEGEKFLTMELVEGESLSSRIARGHLTVPQSISIARSILAGVGAAHSAGVVHRDLKPDNVLVERSGRVVVTDFGIARAEAPNAASQTAGAMVGTPAYMAPEQVSGDAPADARADIYAFGALLFELVTGRRAWPGDSAFSVATARLSQLPPDPRALMPGLAPRLAAVISKCLARDRSQRFASCADVDRELAAISATDGIDGAGATLAAELPDPDLRVREARERSVAVLPFRNLGPTEDAFFALGLAEDLVDALSTVRGLRVRGRSMADASGQDIVETGRRLGVDVVVDGVVRRMGELLRVSARLVGVTDGFQIWSSRFERAAAAAFALNDEVAHAIAYALAADRNDEPRPQPTDPLAVELYFRAKQRIARYWESAHHAEAAELFRQALDRAPNDPTILAGYVHAQLGRNLMWTMDAKHVAAIVRRALIAAPRLPDPWIALAVVRFNQHDDPSGAARALRHALTYGPSNADAHDRAGRLLLEVDRMEDAIAHLERALWVDPSQIWARIDRVRAAALSGDWVQAQSFFDYSGPEWIGRAQIHRARIWSWPGAPETSLPALPDGTSPEVRAMVDGYAWARARRQTGQVPSRAEFHGMLELAERAPAGRARRFLHQLLAEQTAIAGNLEMALEFVSAAVDDGLLDFAWMNRQRLLDPLRGDSRFEALLGAVAARAAQVDRAWREPLEPFDVALASVSAEI